MKSTELLVLNFEEVCRRSLKVWRATQEIADIVLTKKGGDACFRELADRYFPII